MNSIQAKESQSPPTMPGQSPLLEQVRSAARARGDARETADVTVAWARRYILFHNKRHSAQIGLPEATHFLEHVVKTEAEPLPALAQARSALSLRSLQQSKRPSIRRSDRQNS